MKTNYPLRLSFSLRAALYVGFIFFSFKRFPRWKRGKGYPFEIAAENFAAASKKYNTSPNLFLPYYNINKKHSQY